MFCITFLACVKQKHGLTISEGILSVGVEFGYPPMEYYEADGITPAGFDIELTKALGDKLGLQVKYIDTSWEGLLAGLDANRYDIAVNITIIPARQEKYNLTKPYTASSMTIVALKNPPSKIEQPRAAFAVQDLAGYRAAYQSDTTAQYFAERIRSQGIIFASFSYDKILNCFDELLLGRIDFIITDNIVSFYYAEKDDSVFEVIWQGEADEHIAIALKKGNDTLTDALNNALDGLFDDGTIQKIFAANHTN